MTAQLSRRRFLGLSALAAGSALTSLALASCQPKATPTPKAPEQQPTAKPAEKPTEPKKAEEKITVVHWGRSPTEEQVVWSELLPIVEKMAPEISVKFEAPPEDMKKKLIVSFAGGTAPDTAVAGLSDFRGWYGLGITKSIQGYVDKDQDVQSWLPNYVEASIKGYSYKGELYCVPTVSESIELWYNKDAILDAGLTPPAEIEDDPDKWNWDTMLEYAQKINKGQGFRRERFGLICTAAKGVNAITESWGNLVYARGGRAWDEDGEKFLLNSPETAQVLEWIVDLIFKHDVHPDVGEMTSANIRDRAFFQNGQVGMVIQGEYFRRYLWGSGKPSGGIPFQYDMCLVPVDPVTKRRANMYHGNGTCMTNQTKNPDATWKWLKVIFSQEAQQVFTDKWGSRGAHRGTYEAFVKSNAGGGPDGLNYEVFTKADEGTIAYYLPIYTTKEAIVEPWVRILYDNVFLNKMSVTEGLAQIEKETIEIFEKAKAEWQAKRKS
ncbi:MAG: extracellular solute-binding protein [Chloroflexi bacterium]|nr:extracellular solute-binding protein [Chloroflexota bacterium]